MIINNNLPDRGSWPTPYPDVNTTLNELLVQVQEILGTHFIGLYLYGSLATGGFDYERSDIDFLVVTREELSDNLVSDLETMHTNIYESGPEWTTKFEGAYIPIDAMRAYSPTGPACPLVNKKEFLVARPESNWVINRHILYTSGMVVTGPPPQSFIDPVPPEELKEAVLTLLGSNWAHFLRKGDFTGTGHQPFVVLTMCRALYTLENAAVASKKRSVEWLITNSDRKWTKLINQAIAWHYGDPPGDIKQTREFMQYVFKQAGLSGE